MKERRALGIVLLAAAMLSLWAIYGCALFPDRTPVAVLTSINAHAYYEDVYRARCVAVVGPPWCDLVAQELRAWKADTIKAAAEMKTGGKIPLRKKQIKAHEATVRKVLH